MSRLRCVSPLHCWYQASCSIMPKSCSKPPVFLAIEPGHQPHSCGDCPNASNARNLRSAANCLRLAASRIIQKRHGGTGLPYCEVSRRRHSSGIGTDWSPQRKIEKGTGCGKNSNRRTRSWALPRKSPGTACFQPLYNCSWLPFALRASAFSFQADGVQWDRGSVMLGLRVTGLQKWLLSAAKALL